jgi:hypothetical protein
MTTPPRHLSPAAQLEPHHLAVLTKALEASDRADAARLVIDREGLLVSSRLGERKAHPLLSLERDSRSLSSPG